MKNENGLTGDISNLLHTWSKRSKWCTCIVITLYPV